MSAIQSYAAARLAWATRERALANGSHPDLCVAHLDGSAAAARLSPCVARRLTHMSQHAVAFVVPIHPPKFGFLLSLRFSVSQCSVAAAFVPVFTYAADANTMFSVAPSLFDDDDQRDASSLWLPIVVGRPARAAGVAAYKKRE